MNYFRLYPDKNNTLINFEGEGLIGKQYRNLNTGKNTIMELHSGKKNSELIFNFQFPDWLKEQIQNNPNLKCNLVVYDSGAIYDNVMGEKKIIISKFFDDFLEGNGWSFELNNTPHFGKSNFLNRTETDLWVDSDKGIWAEYEYQLDDFHQDIVYDITSILDADKDHINLFLKAKHNYYEQNIIKFLHSRHTRTIYKPYLEFILNDEIIDERNTLKKGKSSRIYIINPSNEDFTGTITCNVNSVDSLVTNLDNGIYFIETTPDEEFIKLEWYLDGVKFYEENYEVLFENPFSPKENNNLNFYIKSNNNQKIFRVGDVVGFEIESFILKKGNVIDSNYEYKVVTNNGFTMQPWTKCNVYLENIWFNLNLGYYFPEMNYEILLRRKEGKKIETSKDNFNFKVIENAETRYKQLSANPYYTREWFFSK